MRLALEFRVSGAAWLFVALTAILGGSLPAAAAAPAAASPVKPPAVGPGANFPREDYVRGLREAPALVARAGIACTVTQAVYEGESSLLNAHGAYLGRARLYEVACAEGLGYFLNLRGNEPPFAVDCIIAGETGKSACMLALNHHPAGGLDPALKAAGVPCRAERARYLGQNDGTRIRRYEVRCASGAGYILDLPLADGRGPPPQAISCFATEEECKLSTHLGNVAALAYAVGKAFGDSCQIGDARYVGYVAARDHDMFEVSCQAGHEGELIEIDRAGALARHTPCSEIKLVGGACKLKADAANPMVVARESEGAGRAVITNPDWVRRPAARNVAEYYPLDAAKSQVTGRATIRCRVLASGSLRECVAIDESPAEFGFGAAAVKMAREFQMRPKTLDGKPVTDGVVEIPINFGVRAW